MKIGTALIFIVIGIWLAYAYPSEASQVLIWAQQGINWARSFMSSL